jgi:hypothetical protein
MTKPTPTGNINWEPNLFFDPTSLDPFASHGIPIPTYGNYGGPGYTAGTLGGTTPILLPIRSQWIRSTGSSTNMISSSRSSRTASSQTRQHLYKRACNLCSECPRSHTRTLVRLITTLQPGSMKGSGHSPSSVSCSSTPARSRLYLHQSSSKSRQPRRRR